MKYLLDTDTSVFILNRSDRLELKCLQVGLDNIAISVITQAELTFGVYYSQHVQQNLQRLLQFCQSIILLPVSSNVVNTFGSLKAKLCRRGETLEDFDIIIAATALAYELTLVTGNVGHFDRVSGLRIENWIRG